MWEQIKTYCDGLADQLGTIPALRKELLEKVSQYIIQKRKDNKQVDLVYICTHNSRRSHFGQLWAQVAANYYGIKGVSAFSGGTEVNAFNSNAIDAIKRIGFEVRAINTGKNPTYHVLFDERESPVVCFSKVYNNSGNPQKDFAAIMTCSDAEENCPFIPGAEFRISTTYDDPKTFDNTPQQDEKYSERCKQVALETFYVFSKVK